MSISELSDRQLAERNYYASLMLFEQISKLKSNINDAKNPALRGISRLLPQPDYEKKFNELLDDYMDSRKESK